MRLQTIAFTIALIPLLTSGAASSTAASVLISTVPSSAEPGPLSEGPHALLREAKVLEYQGRHDEAARRYADAIRGLIDAHGPEHPIVESARGSYRVLQAKRGQP